jgi:hypothetical protein
MACLRIFFLPSSIVFSSLPAKLNDIVLSLNGLSIFANMYNVRQILRISAFTSIFIALLWLYRPSLMSSGDQAVAALQICMYFFYKKVPCSVYLGVTAQIGGSFLIDS